MFQDRLDLTAAQEERRHDVTGEDGVVRTRRGKGPAPAAGDEVRTGHGVADRLPVAGQEQRAPAGCGAEPAGGEAFPRAARLTAIEAARGSMEAAGAAITRATGVMIGKRRLEELARRCAAHVEAFYLQRAVSPAPDDHALVLTFDGKGIVMLPGALRPATAKAAAAAEGKLATRLSPGEKNGRKRMAELACVYDAAGPAHPRRHHQHPRAEEGAAGNVKGREGRGSRRRGEWLTASVTDDVPAVIAWRSMRRERRDPQHTAEMDRPHRRQRHADRGRPRGRPPRHDVTIIIDFVHVLEYLWQATWSFFDKGEPSARMGR